MRLTIRNTSNVEIEKEQFTREITKNGFYQIVRGLMETAYLLETKGLGGKIRRIIGRLSERDMSLNPRHLSIVLGDEGMVLTDLNTKDGSYLNGERFKRKWIQPGENTSSAVMLYDLRLGNDLTFKLTYEPNGE